MNQKEEQTGKVFKNWVEIVPFVREKLNKIRHKNLPKDKAYDLPPPRDYKEVEEKKTVTDKNGKKKACQ